VDRRHSCFVVVAPLGILSPFRSPNRAGGRVSLRERQRIAAAVLRECRDALARGDSTILHQATGAAGDIAAWRRYPEGEVYDPQTHCQYFYHSHGGPEPADSNGRREHGHFHLFLRADGLPAGMTPLVLPELAVADAPLPPQSAPLKRGGRDEVVHLVALALDAHGEPVRLFTTNRWVTGETWYRAEDVIRMLDRFQVSGEGSTELLNRWLTAMVQPRSRYCCATAIAPSRNGGGAGAAMFSKIRGSKLPRAFRSISRRGSRQPRTAASSPPSALPHLPVIGHPGWRRVGASEPYCDGALGARGASR
jgi:uncharacterized protein DUF6969